MDFLLYYILMDFYLCDINILIHDWKIDLGNEIDCHRTFLIPFSNIRLLGQCLNCFWVLDVQSVIFFCMWYKISWSIF